MTKGPKLWIAGGTGILLVVGAVFVFRARHAGDSEAARDEAAEGRDRRWRGFAAGIPGIPADDGAGASGAPGATAAGPAQAAEVLEQVSAVMDAWRKAILNKDANTVLALDAGFRSHPGRFAPALVRVAATDENERVRAFSTRVLGKLRAPALAEMFADLLEDRSPYVRQNAAWALGELGARPDGREAALRAATELRRLGQHDAANDVRVAANSALKRLE
jgi:hypothetical protein